MVVPTLLQLTYVKTSLSTITTTAFDSALKKSYHCGLGHLCCSNHRSAAMEGTLLLRISTSKDVHGGGKAVQASWSDDEYIQRDGE
jgi:hypothetical protein